MRTSSNGYLPGFSSTTRLLERRPAGAGRALRPRRRVKVPRRLIKRYRRALSTTTKRAIRAIRPKAKGPTDEHVLLQRATMGFSLPDLAAIAEMGYDAYLDAQLDYESIDNSELEDSLAESLPSLALTPFQLAQQYEDRPFQPVIDLMVASILRAAYSPRQLYERMVNFWSDHFSIDIFANHAYLLKPVDDREVVRSNALGSFRDLLGASAHSPAMLEYLTNDSNVKGHPNENYARELLELHTMGVDGPYTQKDVREVARAFTGWTLRNVYNRTQDLGTFVFDESVHDRRKKTVLGRKIASGGGEVDGEQVLDLLVAHADTSKFLAEKMARYFLGYQPKKSAVRKAASRFRSSGGDIRSMLKALLSKKNVRRTQPKLKRPFHLAVSAVRATLADAGNGGFLLRHLELAGQLPFAWSAPNGYPDDPEFWSGFVLPRWNFAAEFPLADYSGIRLDPNLIDESASPQTLVKRINRQLFNSTMSKKTKNAIKKHLKDGELDGRRVRQAVGLALASPEFQLY